MSVTNTSQRDPDAKIRLARIFISHDGNNEYEWYGIAPEPGDTLFVYYVMVNDKTYCDNILGSNDKSTFDHFRSKKNNVTISYLYSPNIIRKPPPLHFDTVLFTSHEKNRQATLLPNLMSKGNIFQNNEDFSCWYMLNGPDAYSQEYDKFKDNYDDDYDLLDVRVIDDDDEFNKEYTLLQTYVQKNVDRHVLIRETGVVHPRFKRIFKRKAGASSNTEQQPSKIQRTGGGGGKTRRKFKVKKRRNRRITNTMKRRKTAVKRRKTALKRRNR
jgi:hypothetical protein